MERGDRVFCDVCEQEVAADRTALIGHAGREYEVDLCPDHLRKLDKVLAQFIEVARRVEG